MKITFYNLDIEVFREISTKLLQGGCITDLTFEFETVNVTIRASYGKNFYIDMQEENVFIEIYTIKENEIEVESLICIGRNSYRSIELN